MAAVDSEVLSYQRRALAPIEALVRALTKAMAGGNIDDAGQQASKAGPEQLCLLHKVLRQLAGSDGAAEEPLALPEAAEAVGERVLGLLDALNLAVRLERQEQGMQDAVGAGTVPMPIVGLYALEKAVELTHCLCFFPLLSPSVRRAVPFAASLSPKDSVGGSVPTTDSTPYGEIVVLARATGVGAAASTSTAPVAVPSARLFSLAQRSVVLLTELSEELHPAFLSVRHVAIVFAALLELCYHPEARDTPDGAAHARSCKQLWMALIQALPAQLRTDALLALQASSATPSSSSNASISSRRQAGVGKAPKWFVRAVRFQLSLTIAASKGVSSMLSAVLGTDHADDDRAVSAVARLVGDYGAQQALLGEHTRRYFLAVGKQVASLLVAGLEETDANVDGGVELPTVGAAPLRGEGRDQAATVAAMRTGSAEAWRKAAAKVASATLRSAPPEVGFDSLVAPCLTPLAALLPDLTLTTIDVSETTVAYTKALEPEPEPEPVPTKLLCSEGSMHRTLLTLASMLRGSGAPRHVIMALPTSFLRLVYRLTAFASQRAPLAPVRALGLYILTTVFVGLGRSAAILYAMLGLAPHTTVDEEDGSNGAGLFSDVSLQVKELEWGLELGPTGGLQAVRLVPEYEAASDGEGASGAHHNSATDDVDDEQEGLWDGDWMALLAGESLLAIELLESCQTTGDDSHETSQKLPHPSQQQRAELKEDEAEGSVSCEAELFVLLLQLYTETTPAVTALGQPRSAPMQLLHWRQVCKYKSGLVLEALATQRSAALCGKASLPVLLPMLDSLLRQPTDILTRTAAAGRNTDVCTSACKHDQAEGGTCEESLFLSGESAEEQARARIAAAEGVRDAIDTLQLVLGVLLAIFDPEVERLATMGGGGTDWSSRTIDGGSAIAAAAGILRQIDRLTSAADNRATASRTESETQETGRQSNGRRIFSSPSERLALVAEETEAAGAAELQAVVQLAGIVRLRILAALSTTSDARGDSIASADSKCGGAPAPGDEGSVEALSVRARCGDWVQSLPASAIVALSELASPMPPIRAKGLSGLRSLLLARESALMGALKELIPLIEEAMQDQDSFVFLAAINTLVGLADVAPSEALPLLAARLSDEAVETPLRLMLTEVLEKAARQCGDVLPHYAPLFVNAFMGGTGSQLPALRCSAVSALGTLCAKLRYALRPYLVDIVPTACHMLAMDEEASVRQAAAYLLAELVVGLEDSFWDILPDWLQLLYNTLKRAAYETSNTDDVTRQHAERGLDAIGERARAFLFPKTRVQHPKILEL